MQLILTIRESDIHPGVTDRDNLRYKDRRAARAVVLNDKGGVALLKVTKQNYHKLPGGGVEPGEDMLQALKRELLEEIGCEAEIIGEVGQIIEYRDEWQMRQISDCYVVKKVGKQLPTNFDDGELADGFEVFWANDIDHALLLLEQDTPANYDGEFIQKRDLALLTAAKNLA